jgi:hypothetical protein
MPLESGSSKEVISRNIATEREHGKPEKQAVAIAFHKSREDAEPVKPVDKEKIREMQEHGKLAPGKHIHTQKEMQKKLEKAGPSPRGLIEEGFARYRKDVEAICDSLEHLDERIDAYGKRRADAGPREENFQRAAKASENREKEERDKKLEQIGRAFGRSRGDEEESARADLVLEVSAVALGLGLGNLIYDAIGAMWDVHKIKSELRKKGVSEDQMKSRVREVLALQEKYGRGDTARGDAYDSVDGGSMELLSKMRTDTARADFDVSGVLDLVDTILWGYVGVQALKLGWGLGRLSKAEKELRAALDKIDGKSPERSLIQRAIDKVKQAMSGK